MMIIILPISFSLLFYYFLITTQSFRLAIINSYLFFSLQILLITEFLTFFNSLIMAEVFLAHLFFNIIYISLLFRMKIKIPRPKTINNKSTIILLMIGFIVLITFITAIFSPSNNWDSMTYHMARIAHWIQNEGVDFFLTNNYRQNAYSPFNEFIILNLQLLSNSDLFANLSQWFSLIICVTATTLITKEFGLNKYFQIVSGFLVCTLPLAILQASTTKNDVVLSTFIMLFYYYQINSINNQSKLNLVCSGISLGLGVLSKGTSYSLLFPIGIIFFLYNIIIKNYKSKLPVIYRAVTTVIIGLLINLPHYFRCHIKYNDFLAMNVNSEAKNETLSIFTVFSNLIRWTALQLGSTFELLNWYIYKIVKIFLGDKISDPGTSYMDLDFRPPFFMIHEDHSGNLIHTLLIIFLFIISFYYIKRFKKIQLISLIISIFSIILFCLLFKWNPYTGRTIPIFIITTPFLSIVLNQLYFSYKMKIVINLIFLSLFLYSMPFLFFNKARPILPFDNNSIFYKQRIKNYFSNRPDLYDQYFRIVDGIHIKKFDENNNIKIGLFIGGDSWEYPFWVMLKNKFHSNIPDIEHLIINNHNKFYTKKDLKKIHKFLIVENKYLKVLGDFTENYSNEVLTDDFSLLINSSMK